MGGWHEAQFEENRRPTRPDLDRVVPDNPCYVQYLYDEAVLNSAALAQSGLVDSGVELEGAEDVVRRADGEPTGVVGAMLPSPVSCRNGRSDARSTRSFNAGDAGELASFGLTEALDPGGSGWVPIATSRSMRSGVEDSSPLRLRLYLGAGTRGEEQREILDWLRFLPRNFGDNFLRIIGIGEIIVFKCWDADGVAPFKVDRESFEEFEELSRLVAREAWPMHVHSVLDASAGAILDAWEAVTEDHAIAPLRFSFAHAGTGLASETCGGRRRSVSGSRSRIA